VRELWIVFAGKLVQRQSSGVAASPAATGLLATYASVAANWSSPSMNVAE